ncbi:IclR family transcriptional regulator [Pusillimonas sp. CC-YST705]|uniref:IclR family transcriptional regulator n=1 Tax=Mesopusillimonas faecipullorum TaxID=2755040 RepID=A0ABS8CBM4_9BURK|nr:IclR family transcriptional regulator [Mesopusillimonas faecipullorum]MCB5363435.1 IclR family transcriptional regulator [Mesopusillimonas faecipullorum]
MHDSPESSRSAPRRRHAGDTERRRIQSIETGFALVTTLVDAATPLSLGDLAKRAGMSAAKAHPYLVSFINVGLVRQDVVTGQYELGPFAMQMGLVSLQRLDPIRVALPQVSALSSRIGHTLCLAVMGSHGPTVVHISEASYPVHVNLRPGTVMSLRHTATGRVFAAWLPEAVLKHFLEREAGDKAVVTSVGHPSPTESAWQADLQDIRARGMARAQGHPLPGVNAFSLPVFNHEGQIVLALTCLGPSFLLDTDWESPIAASLKQCADMISIELGKPAV